MEILTCWWLDMYRSERLKQNIKLMARYWFMKRIISIMWEWSFVKLNVMTGPRTNAKCGNLMFSPILRDLHVMTMMVVVVVVVAVFFHMLGCCYASTFSRIYIMAGCAFVFAKQVFYHRYGNILKLWEWLKYVEHICTRKIIFTTFNWNILTLAMFSPNVHWWANQARSWLLRTQTFCIIWGYQLIRQRLSFPLYNTHPTWLSPTNELKFDD